MKCKPSVSWSFQYTYIFLPFCLSVVVGLLFLGAISLIPPLVNSQAFCIGNNALCVYSQQIQNSSTIQFRVEVNQPSPSSSSKHKNVGWASFGLAKPTSDSNMNGEVFVMWKNPTDNSITLSRRDAMGEVMPLAVNNQSFTVVIPSETGADSNGFHVTFQRPMASDTSFANEVSLVNGKLQTMIWAYGPQPSSSSFAAT